MRTGTGIFWLALVLLFGSMFEFEVLQESRTSDGSDQWQVIRYNVLTGSMSTCIVDFEDTDQPWASCSIIAKD